MIKKLILAFALIYSGTLPAQISVNMFLSGRPPANLSDWANRKEVLTFIMGGSQTVRFDVKIKSEIKTIDGTVIGTTNLNTAKTYSPLPGANTVLGALDVLPMENIIFSGKYQSTLQKTGKLPADNYMLCVQLLRLPDYAPASEIICKPFYLAAYQLPILMMPANEQELNSKIAQTAITFRWTPVVPSSPTRVTYRLQVFEVLENQHDVQALRSNQPLLDKNIIGTTQFIWQPQLGVLPNYYGEAPTGGDEENNEMENKQTPQSSFGEKVNAGRQTQQSSFGEKVITGKRAARFIWTIQTLDNSGMPLNQTDGNGESRSEPHIFFISPVNQNPTNKVKEEKTKGLKDTLKTQV